MWMVLRYITDVTFLDNGSEIYCIQGGFKPLNLADMAHRIEEPPPG